MMTSKFSKGLTLFSAAYLILFALFLIILGWVNPLFDGEAEIVMFALFYCCGLIPVGFFSTSWLLWSGREKLSNILIWFSFQILFVLSMAMYDSAFLGLLFSTLLIVIFPLLGIVDFFFAKNNGYSLRFIGWGSVGIIWSILLMWRFKGNLIDEYIDTLVTGSNSLWLLNALMYGFGWMVIAGVISFVFELISVLSKEYHAG
ncbi:MAG TPA: hypothetical protein PLV64_02625 [Anaerolineales bacterium]|nr:hypothetical protein [Anaerolineales bacterium]